MNVNVKINTEKYELMLGNKVGNIAREIEAIFTGLLKPKYRPDIDIDHRSYPDAVYIHLNIQRTMIKKDIDYTECFTISNKFEKGSPVFDYFKLISIPEEVTIKLKLPKEVKPMFR